jgi:hypothetical protein
MGMGMGVGAGAGSLARGEQRRPVGRRAQTGCEDAGTGTGVVSEVQRATEHEGVSENQRA